MVIYKLSCVCGFQTKGWFADEAAYLRGKENHNLNCPMCNHGTMQAKDENDASEVSLESATELPLGRLAEQLFAMMEQQDKKPIDINNGVVLNENAVVLGIELINGKGEVLIDIESSKEKDEPDINTALATELDQLEKMASPLINTENIDIEGSFKVEKEEPKLLEATFDSEQVDINWQILSPHSKNTWRRNRKTRLKVAKPSTIREAKKQEIEKNILDLARNVISKALASLLVNKPPATLDGADGIISREDLEVLREEGIESLAIALPDKRRLN